MHPNSYRPWLLGALWVALALLPSCGIFDDKSSTEPVSEPEPSRRLPDAKGQSPSLDEAPAASSGSATGRSLAPRSVTLSFTNAGDSAFFASPRRAKQRLAFLKSQKAANAAAQTEWQLDQLVLMRLLGASYPALYVRSKKTMDARLSANINAKTPERLLLELASTAFKQGKVVLAEFYIRQISASKNAFWVSNALTLQGLIYLKENKLPEAALEWQAALAKSPSNQAAATNLGLMALKYGDLKTAVQRLSRAGGHWQAKLGLAIAARQQKQYPKARALCNQVLSQQKRSKSALLSCALVEADGFKNVAKASAYLDDALKLTNGTDRVNEKILATKRKLARLKAKKP